MKRAKKFREILIQDLKDPKEASAYLDAAIREADPKFLLLALSDVAQALGQLGKVERILRSKKVLDMPTLELSLKMLGLHLTVVPEEKNNIRRAA